MGALTTPLHKPAIATKRHMGGAHCASASAGVTIQWAHMLWHSARRCCGKQWRVAPKIPSEPDPTRQLNYEALRLNLACKSMKPPYPNNILRAPHLTYPTNIFWAPHLAYPSSICGAPHLTYPGSTFGWWSPKYHVTETLPGLPAGKTMRLLRLNLT